MEERKRKGPRRGEYCARPSRQARLRTGNDQNFCGWAKWTHAATASRSTPPAALSICSEGTIPLPLLPQGGTPLSEGGECLRAPHALNTAPIAPTPLSQSTKIPEEPEFFRFRDAKRWENSFQASANAQRAGMGQMSIVRATTEVPDTGRPSLPALLGRPLEQTLGSFAGALAEASDKSEFFSLLPGRCFGEPWGGPRFVAAALEGVVG